MPPSGLFSNKALNLQVGQYGSRIVSTTGSVVGDFGAIYCITSTQFASMTDPYLSGDAISVVTYPAGSWIYGHISAFQVVTGSIVQAYAVLRD